MAVTLTEDDFLQPEGELSLDLFPGENLETLTSVLINGWLQQAIGQVEGASVPTASENEAAKAWVYYRGYSHIADRLMSSAASATIDGKVSRSMTGDQRSYFAGKAAAKLALFNGFTPTTVDGPAIPVFFAVAGAGRRCCV